MNWTQGKLSYYSDFALVPLLVLACAPFADWHGVPLGYMLWSFSEYAMHRWVFHVLTRKQHWKHHSRPTGYVAVSGLWSAGIHVALLLVAYLTGELGVFIGYEIGYLLYILVHDRIHHDNKIHQGWVGWWLFRRGVLHDVHHRGVEANFGVVHSWWDHVFGTYCNVAQQKAWLARQRKSY